MAKSGQSSSKMAKLASKTLKSKKATPAAKKLAGSVLSQAPNKKKK